MQLRQLLRGAFILVMMLAISGVIYGQEENLLDNPGFEDSFSGSGDARVGSSWQSWVADDTNAPDFQEAPAYFPASDADDALLIPQVRSGSDAQAIFSFFATHDAGIYQEVSGITEGAELRFSIYGHIFSNTSSNLEQSETPGGVAIRVGIDPDGGTDPFADEIVYSEPFITYDTFIQYNIIATAESDTVTVFVRSTVSEPVQNTIVFLDDAVLNVTPESTVPDDSEADKTEEPAETEEVETEEAVETEAVDTEATPTREGVVETEEAETEEAVETEEPTEEAVETEEVETEEPTETEEVETEEPTEEATSEEPITEDFPGTVLHTVRRGDTVGRLAVRYGSSTQAIIDANDLDESALIFVGQGLVIPVRIVPATETPSPTPQVVVVTATQNFGTGGATASTYTVQRGDSLSLIARRFNTTVGTLVNLNGIVNPNQILVGQVLSLPGNTPAPAATPVPETETPEPETETAEEVVTEPETEESTTYTVQPGDNLYRIALANGVTIGALAEANNITNFNLIFVGQELTIP
ncbi:MAG: LysM peptidoglycan-binding domain-containing protein [Chloroflexota bacterium]